MTTLAKIDRDTLTEAFRQAAAAALAADQDDDGGTCNFDTPALRLTGMREKAVQECAEAAGINASAFEWFGRRWFFVFVPLHGQANRRSRMAEAGTRRLKELGLHASLFCQAD